ncbi:hypothetical protein GW17_00052797 [Ensete ventricosum]|nr:hypothetical protein GW17_00052797 [Ensete ventricosum]
MARPSAGVASHEQAPCRGGRPRPGHLQRGDQLWPRPPARGRPTMAKALYKGCGTRKEWPPATSPQGAVAAARAATGRGSSFDRKSGCRLARAAVACAGATTMAQKGQEGLGQSFCEKDDPTPMNLGNFEDCHRV